VSEGGGVTILSLQGGGGALVRCSKVPRGRAASTQPSPGDTGLCLHVRVYFPLPQALSFLLIGVFFTMKRADISSYFGLTNSQVLPVYPADVLSLHGQTDNDLVLATARCVTVWIAWPAENGLLRRALIELGK
jgi:hypothetical protein